MPVTTQLPSVLQTAALSAVPSTAAPSAFLEDVPAPVVLPAIPATTSPFQPDKVRHLIFGTLAAIQLTIKELHKRGYAEPNDWSQPLPTGRPGEVMAILTKRVEELPQP
ncbi:hypothetical protein VB741_15240 [Leptothoe sp. PORK10 BA2]|nr:hypothetical protein [Leptothoe sp. PORK10 BA2]